MTKPFLLEDFFSAFLDFDKEWPSTVEKEEDVAYWRDVQNDPEAQQALKDVGLA